MHTRKIKQVQRQKLIFFTRCNREKKSLNKNDFLFREGKEKDEEFQTIVSLNLI